ncbi:hypothetical protein D1871_02795 [Nakamurella silvestris]|nr:hypothetical protein D1871_02795 [Nakamurella silvestris]
MTNPDRETTAERLTAAFAAASHGEPPADLGARVLQDDRFVVDARARRRPHMTAAVLVAATVVAVVVVASIIGNRRNDGAALAPVPEVGAANSTGSSSAIAPPATTGPTGLPTTAGPPKTGGTSSPYPAPGNPVRMRVEDATVQVLDDGRTFLCPTSVMMSVDDLGVDHQTEVGRCPTDGYAITGLTSDGPNGTWLTATNRYRTFDLEGDFDGRTFATTEQRAPEPRKWWADDPFGTIPAPACAGPDGGWPRRSGGTGQNFNRVVKIANAHPAVFGGVTVAVPGHEGEMDPQMIDHQVEILNIGYVGDRAKAATLVETVYTGNYCLVPVKYSRADLRTQSRWFADHLKPEQISSFGESTNADTLNESVTPQIVIGVHFVDADIAALISGAEKVGPPVAVDAWMEPLGG